MYMYLNISNDTRVELSVELIGNAFGRCHVSEEVLVPSSSLRESFPHRVDSYLTLNQFLPEQSIGNDTVPLVADQLSSTEAFGIQVGENLIGNVV